MKKIYNYILPVLFTVFAASCDGDDEEVIRMQNQDPVVTVTSVSDAVGYVGNEFTIYGTNFGIIANDVEVLFNTRYVGIVPNDASGRATLWNDIVKLIQQLETLRAVEDFDPDTVSVDIGDRKGSVLLTIDGLNIVNAMSQLYMSVIIQ